jgi:hypothetical protein
MQGQLNLHTQAGNTIMAVSSYNDVNTIVEIGTWNGYGTTNCVLTGIKFRPEVKFYSLECDISQYNTAISHIEQSENIKLILGKIVNDNELDIEALSNDEKGWLKNDLEQLANVPNVLEQLPDTIDFLILDGGEFSTMAELAKLKDRSKYIFLDDTTCRKNKQNRDNLNKDINFEILVDEQNDRNGWSLFKRIAI